MKVMAVDAGFRACGIVVMELGPNLEWRIVDMRCPVTTGRAKKLGVRVADADTSDAEAVAFRIFATIRAHSIKHLVVELPSGGARGARPNRCMGIATGIIAAVVMAEGLVREYYTPMETRRAAVPGTSRSISKQEVISAMMYKYPCLADAGNDPIILEACADALATFEAARSGNIIRQAESDATAR